MLKTLGYTMIVAVVWSCSPIPKGEMENENLGPAVPAEGAEVSYRATPISIGGPSTEVIARAQFKRLNDETGFEQTLPIRFAEYWILDSSNTVIQQGETDVNGDLTALIPQVAGTYTLQIRSRAFNSEYKASVLNTPYEKQVYALDFSFQTNPGDVRSPASGFHLAQAERDHSGNLLGGAFNILHNVYLANQYLKAQLSPAPEIPKAQIYWQKGVTPAIYFGGTGGISFYVSQSGSGLYKGLYILGGQSGALCTDTDHFDNSVILHEYAHFLEHEMAKSDSPGGSHDGRRIIDPRLAWSEGYANYFQGAVLQRANYRDTVALGCGNQNLGQILFDLIKTSNFSTTTDIPTITGEGNFREMAVARYLYSITSNHAATGSALYAGQSLTFSSLWNSFLTLSNSSFVGRSIHHFNRSYVTAISNPTQQSEFKSSEKPFGIEHQVDNLNDWARPLVQSSAPCSPSEKVDADGYFTILNAGPKPDKGTNGFDLSCGSSSAIAWSDMFNSNDFHILKLASPTSEQVWIEYNSQSGTPFDLDLYLYRRDFVFLNVTDILRSSERFYPEESSTGLERISLSGIPADSYFLNIKVDQPSCPRTTTRYRIRIGSGQYLCPNPNSNAN